MHHRIWSLNAIASLGPAMAVQTIHMVASKTASYDCHADPIVHHFTVPGTRYQLPMLITVALPHNWVYLPWYHVPGENNRVSLLMMVELSTKESTMMMRVTATKRWKNDCFSNIFLLLSCFVLIAGLGSILQYLTEAVDSFKSKHKVDCWILSFSWHHFSQKKPLFYACFNRIK